MCYFEVSQSLIIMQYHVKMYTMFHLLLLIFIHIWFLIKLYERNLRHEYNYGIIAINFAYQLGKKKYKNYCCWLHWIYCLEIILIQEKINTKNIHFIQHQRHMFSFWFAYSLFVVTIKCGFYVIYCNCIYVANVISWHEKNGYYLIQTKIQIHNYKFMTFKTATV